MSSDQREIELRSKMEILCPNLWVLTHYISSQNSNFEIECVLTQKVLGQGKTEIECLENAVEYLERKKP